MKTSAFFLLFPFLLFLSFSMSAQDSLRQEALYLIDGSILNGRILEQTEGFTRIKIISGDVLLLNNDLIIRTGDRAVPLKDRPKRSALQKKGTYNILSVGVLAGRDAQLEDGLVTSLSGLHYVRGYQFNQYIGVGAGVGLDIYRNKFMPIYADFRGNFNIKKLSLFYSLQSGYAFTSENFGGEESVKTKGGLLVYPAVGIKIPTRSKIDVLLEFGYRNQWAKKEYTWRDNPDKIIYRRYAFRIGFSF